MAKVEQADEVPLLGPCIVMAAQLSFFEPFDLRKSVGGAIQSPPVTGIRGKGADRLEALHMSSAISMLWPFPAQHHALRCPQRDVLQSAQPTLENHDCIDGASWRRALCSSARTGGLEMTPNISQKYKPLSCATALLRFWIVIHPLLRSSATFLPPHPNLP
jgi:hypothetical protein